MKATMQLDPGLDVVANRGPVRTYSSTSHWVGERIFVGQIQRLACGLDQAGALVIFPGRVATSTPGRWQRSIRRLDPASVPPRPGPPGRGRCPTCCRPAPGQVLAITACPDADAVSRGPRRAGPGWSASGNVRASSPMDQVIHAKWWRVPAGEVPRSADRAGQGAMARPVVGAGRLVHLPNRPSDAGDARSAVEEVVVDVLLALVAEERPPRAPARGAALAAHGPRRSAPELGPT